MKSFELRASGPASKGRLHGGTATGHGLSMPPREAQHGHADGNAVFSRGAARNRARHQARKREVADGLTEVRGMVGQEIAEMRTEMRTVVNKEVGDVRADICDLKHLVLQLVQGQSGQHAHTSAASSVGGSAEFDGSATAAPCTPAPRMAAPASRTPSPEPRKCGETVNANTQFSRSSNANVESVVLMSSEHNKHVMPNHTAQLDEVDANTPISRSSNVCVESACLVSSEHNKQVMPNHTAQFAEVNPNTQIARSSNASVGSVVLVSSDHNVMPKHTPQLAEVDANNQIPRSSNASVESAVMVSSEHNKHVMPKHTEQLAVVNPNTQISRSSNASVESAVLVSSEHTKHVMPKHTAQLDEVDANTQISRSSKASVESDELDDEFLDCEDNANVSPIEQTLSKLDIICSRLEGIFDDLMESDHQSDVLILDEAARFLGKEPHCDDPLDLMKPVGVDDFHWYVRLETLEALITAMRSGNIGASKHKQSPNAAPQLMKPKHPAAEATAPVVGNAHEEAIEQQHSFDIICSRLEGIFDELIDSDQNSDVLILDEAARFLGKEPDCDDPLHLMKPVGINYSHWYARLEKLEALITAWRREGVDASQHTHDHSLSDAPRPNAAPPLQTLHARSDACKPQNGSKMVCSNCKFNFKYYEDDSLVCPCGGLVCPNCLEKNGVCHICYGNGHDSRYKTRLCRLFAAGDCGYGQRCAFAHGEAELRQKATSDIISLRTNPPARYYAGVARIGSEMLASSSLPEFELDGDEADDDDEYFDYDPFAMCEEEW